MGYGEINVLLMLCLKDKNIKRPSRERPLLYVLYMLAGIHSIAWRSLSNGQVDYHNYENVKTLQTICCFLLVNEFIKGAVRYAKWMLPRLARYLHRVAPVWHRIHRHEHSTVYGPCARLPALIKHILYIGPERTQPSWSLLGWRNAYNYMY